MGRSEKLGQSAPQTSGDGLALRDVSRVVVHDPNELRCVQPRHAVSVRAAPHREAPSNDETRHRNDERKWRD